MARIPKWRPWTCRECGHDDWLDFGVRSTVLGCGHVQIVAEVTEAERAECERRWEVFKRQQRGATMKDEQQEERGEMTMREAARLGAEATKRKHPDHHQRIGRLGGAKVRELVARGRAAEAAE